MKIRFFIAVLFLLTNSLFAQNIFVGQWKLDGTERYYRFNTDGTGGISNSPNGNFIEDFSFLIWEGTGITTGYPKVNTLLLASGSGNSPHDISLKLYSYTASGDTVTLKDSDGKEFVFTRVAGNPTSLDIRPHPLLGQWEAKWNGGNHDGALGIWSFLYRPDGTVRAYHHRLHQFDNAYLVRGNVLVIIGEWRFHPAFPANLGSISEKGKDKVFVQEVGGTTWDYQKKKKVTWKK